MDRPPEIIDRDREWQELLRALDSPDPELVFVRGRRRAGKSFLLSHLARLSGGIYYQATRRTEDEQLGALGRVLGARFEDPALRRTRLASWEDSIRYCAERSGGEPLLVVFDEFPYLVDAAPALPSILQAMWDHELAGTRIKIVLCGSHISAMKRLTEADQPLFGRRTALIQVDPLGYRDAGEFFPEHSPRDRMLAYGIFGGLPGHLSLLDPAITLQANVVRHVLSPSGRLHEEAVHAFDAFLSGAGVHYSIVEAIAGGETRWHKISSRLGKAASSLSRPLDWLQTMEVVERVAPITEYPHPSPKRTVYRLRDPYLRFWHRFVSDLRARGVLQTAPPEEVWAAFIEPGLDEYIGSQVFEEACRQFLAARPDVLPFSPVQVGSWWSSDHSEEVDAVALGPRNELLVAECKWGSVSRGDLRVLERRASMISGELDTVSALSLAIFSGGPIDDPAVEKAVSSGHVLHFGLDALFA